MDYFVERDSETAKKYRFDLFYWNMCEDGGFVSRHMHSAIEILYLLKGSCQIDYGESTVEANAGDMVLIRSNVIHSMTSTGADYAEYYVIKLHPRLLFHILSGESDKYSLFFLDRNSKDKVLFTASELKETAVLEMWKSSFNTEMHQEGIPALKSRAFCAGIITEMLSFCDGENHSSGIAVNEDKLRRIYNSTSYIDEHYMEEITALDCAKAANMSYSLFSQCFKTVMGKSVKQHLTEIRLMHAQNMLLTTSLPITEISVSVGYNNVSHFIQEFKRQYGKSPKLFKKTQSSAQNGTH